MEQLNFCQIVRSLVKTSCWKLDRRLKDATFRQDATITLVSEVLPANFKSFIAPFIKRRTQNKMTEFVDFRLDAHEQAFIARQRKKKSLYSCCSFRYTSYGWLHEY